ncbi:hypothetical protein [Mycobacterium sp.]
MIKTLLKGLLLLQLGTCSGCRRPYPGDSEAAGWLTQHSNMVMRARKCPDCQSPEERALWAVEDAIGPKYKREGLRLIEQPEQANGDQNGSQAQAS